MSKFNSEQTERPNPNSDDVILDKIFEAFANFPKHEVSFVLNENVTNGSTIPFLARYRKQKLSHMTPNDMRDVIERYEEMVETKKSAERFLKKNRDSLLPTEVDLLATCVVKEEFDHIKSGLVHKTKKKLSQCESEMLSQVVEQICHNKITNENDAVSYTRGLLGQNRTEVLNAVRNALMCKLTLLSSEFTDNCKKSLLNDNGVILQSELKNEKKSSSSTKEKETKSGDMKRKTDVKSHSFDTYHNFSRSVARLYAHQIMAIYRGEAQKALKVTVTIPERYGTQFRSSLQNSKDLNVNLNAQTNVESFLTNVIKETYKTRIEPKFVRFVRSSLKIKAIKESTEVLQRNLKQILTSEPMKVGTIMGIDPGFKNGCKVGVISHVNELVAHGVLWLDPRSSKEKEKLVDMIRKFSVDYVSVGNGCGCSNVEQVLSQILKEYPDLSHLKYVIVGETGVSIWSVSDEAAKEFPNVEPNIRSAIGLARRLRDPLSELSRVAPQHLSVGQYQLDIPEKKLNVAMNDTMQEVVSFAGVDLNTTGSHVLQHIAGIGAKMAEKIVQCRESLPDRRFISRDHLKHSVKGLGAKTYEQCAGFVKVFPYPSDLSSECHQPNNCTTKCRNLGESLQDGAPVAKKMKKDNKKEKTKNGTNLVKTNPLDVTNIHPTMYPIAEELLSIFGFENITAEDILNGEVAKVMKSVNCEQKISSLTKKYNCDEEKSNDFDFVLKYLSGDCQSENTISRRHFIDIGTIKTQVSANSDSVKSGETYTGRVKNNTEFGAFIEFDSVCDDHGKVTGLAPISLNKIGDLQCGQPVTFRVFKIDSVKRRYTLKII